MSGRRRRLVVLALGMVVLLVAGLGEKKGANADPSTPTATPAGRSAELTDDEYEATRPPDRDRPRDPRGATGMPGLPDGRAPPLPQGVPPVVHWEAEVTVTPELLKRMMQAEVAANRKYLESVRVQQGEEAARQAEEALRAPYLERIAEIEAGAQAPVEVPMLTLYGLWTFSEVSYKDADLTPADPVSILFYRTGSKSGVYARMDSIHTCWPG